MSIHIELAARAFAVLESMPQATAFGVFRHLDRLSLFPEMGAPLGHRFPKLEGLRQLIYKRKLRIIYEFDRTEETVFILAIQYCKQNMPSRRALKRDKLPGEELPLD